MLYREVGGPEANSLSNANLILLNFRGVFLYTSIHRWQNMWRISFGTLEHLR
jgi:hypothetical protein